MEIKGSAVRSIVEYVKKNYPSDFERWLDSLPDESKNIMKFPVYATSWYPMKEAAIIPTRKISEMFFRDFKQGAWETGRFSALIALTGVYKIFVKVSSPAYIIQRASKILPTYYQPSVMTVVNSTQKSVLLHISEFSEMDKTIEYRIGGWIEKALEISNCKNINIGISKSLTIGNDVSEYSITWS